jgi:hypothetical protein
MALVVERPRGADPDSDDKNAPEVEVHCLESGLSKFGFDEAKN